MTKKAVIIGAGPAGLTAAYELLKQTGIKPVILEAEDFCGGISRTYNYKNNRMDMGGHRFFSKNDGVMKWWTDILPLQGAPAADDILLGRAVFLSPLSAAPDPEKEDKVMLHRNRVSRIYYLKNFFDYPVSLNFNTVKGLGPRRMVKAGLSYLKAALTPGKEEKTLEDFMVNRFGRELYLTFFKDYTEKVWGVSCRDIPADWGAQRIKGLSITKILADVFKKLLRLKTQKNSETSLIETFLYPKFGPGQLWEEVARKIIAAGGEIIYGAPVAKIEIKEGKVLSVTAAGKKHEGDYFISSMPVKDLVNACAEVPPAARKTADGLMYRNLRTAGLLYKKLKIKNTSKIKTVNGIAPDTWIYIQETDVKMGRLQIFNNWSPYLPAAADKTVWLGTEYFCFDSGEIWRMNEEDFVNFAAEELEKTGIAEKKDLLDGCSARVPKAYPAYFGTYKNFQEIISFTGGIENLYLIGRNGMHRYNNMDHSMLSAMEAVKNIKEDRRDKTNIWTVNTEESYHERK